ncbi:histidine kinase OS=Streptomyces tendae OX=1932 GN=GUR47_17635 PE=4 SV=1 [Streptomyces tendae]
MIGLPLLAAGLLGARQLGKLERARGPGAARGAGGRAEPAAVGRAVPAGSSPQLWMAVKDPVGWRTVLYDVIRLPWGVAHLHRHVDVVVRAVAGARRSSRGRLADVDRAMVRGLLSPSDELERRIAELESDRGVVVDTAAADLRRIERDLHDGAQARLVNLAMGLGLAKEKLLEDPENAAASMVAEAHGEVKLALQELRDLARAASTRPVLTDRGLDAGPVVGLRRAARCR